MEDINNTDITNQIIDIQPTETLIPLKQQKNIFKPLFFISIFILITVIIVSFLLIENFKKQQSSNENSIKTIEEAELIPTIVSSNINQKESLIISLEDGNKCSDFVEELESEDSPIKDWYSKIKYEKQPMINCSLGEMGFVGLFDIPKDKIKEYINELEKLSVVKNAVLNGKDTLNY